MLPLYGIGPTFATHDGFVKIGCQKQQKKSPLKGAQTVKKHLIRGLEGRSPPSEIRIPGAFPKSSIWRRHPALARDRLPASGGRPVSPTCAVDSEALRSKVSLRVSPTALNATQRREQIQGLRAASAQNADICEEGKRVLSEKITAGELFRHAEAP